MFKAAIVVLIAAGAMALAVLVAVFANPVTRPVRASPEARESVVAPGPSVRDDAVRKPAPMREPTSAGSRLRKPDQAAGEHLDEASLIATLHDLAASDPPRSLELAREAVARFPDSAIAPEFEWNVVKALANMDRYEEAAEEARRMLEKYPGNVFSDDVEHHLLNHPPNPPGTPAPQSAP
jgi:tetratricopeptide (TPR) repeat protein